MGILERVFSGVESGELERVYNLKRNGKDEECKGVLPAKEFYKKASLNEIENELGRRLKEVLCLKKMI